MMNPPAKPADPQPREPDKRPTGAPDAVTRHDDDEDEWRHEPVAPVDERNPLRSLGEAVGETVTGSDADTSVRKRGAARE